jgi:Protein of unknown function (DUF1488)
MPLHFVRYRGHSLSTKSARFVLYDGDKEIQCAVSDTAMDDAEHARDVQPSHRDDQFRRLKDHIVNCASRKFFAGQFERGLDPRILVKTTDLTPR